MKFTIKDFFSKYDQIHSFQLIWSHLLRKSLIENFIFRAVQDVLSALFTNFVKYYSTKDLPVQVRSKSFTAALWDEQFFM